MDFGRAQADINWSGIEYHNVERRASTDPEGSFFKDEPMLEVIPRAGIHDLVFTVDNDILVGTSFLWLYSEALTSAGGFPLTAGWDMVKADCEAEAGAGSAACDLDRMPIRLAWDGQSTVHMDTTPRSVDSCQSCVQVDGGMADLVIGSGIGDVKYARMYGVDGAGERDAAERACPGSSLGVEPRDVDVFESVDGAVQAWMPLMVDGQQPDTTMNRGLLFDSDFLEPTDRWCWDAAKATGLSTGNFHRDFCTDEDTGFTDTAGPCPQTGTNADGEYELLCSDSGKFSRIWWKRCDEREATEELGDGDKVFHFQEQSVGNPLEVEGIATDQAILLTSEGTFADTSVGGEGLWIVTYDSVNTPSTGLAYEALTLDLPSDFCTAFFTLPSDVTGGKSTPRMQVVEASIVDADGADTFVMYATSSNSTCKGLYRVDVDQTALTATFSDVLVTSDWTTLSPPPCPDIIADEVWGAEVDRDGRWVLLYGGTLAGVCAVDVSNWPSWTAKQVVSADEQDGVISTLIAHPHVQDVWFYGAYTFYEAFDDLSDSVPGVYVIQRRRRAVGPGWAEGWGSMRISDDRLEHQGVQAITWGAGYSFAGNGEVEHLYVAAGGYWDLDLVTE